MWDLPCKGLARWDSVLPMQPRNSETGLWKDQPGSQQLHICASFPLFLSSILSCSWEKSDAWPISLARKHFTIMGTGRVWESVWLGLQNQWSTSYLIKLFQALSLGQAEGLSSFRAFTLWSLYQRKVEWSPPETTACVGFHSLSQTW